MLASDGPLSRLGRLVQTVTRAQWVRDMDPGPYSIQRWREIRLDPDLECEDSCECSNHMLLYVILGPSGEAVGYEMRPLDDYMPTLGLMLNDSYSVVEGVLKVVEGE